MNDHDTDPDDVFDPDEPVPGIDCSPFGMSPVLATYRLRKVDRPLTAGDRTEIADMIDRFVRGIEQAEAKGAPNAVPPPLPPECDDRQAVLAALPDARSRRRPGNLREPDEWDILLGIGLRQMTLTTAGSEEQAWAQARRIAEAESRR